MNRFHFQGKLGSYSILQGFSSKLVKLNEGWKVKKFNTCQKYKSRLFKIIILCYISDKYSIYPLLMEAFFVTRQPKWMVTAPSISLDFHYKASDSYDVGTKG